MKTLTILITSIFLTSCAVTWTDLKPIAIPLTALIIKKHIQNNPDKTGEYIKALDKLDTLLLSDISNLTLEDFVKLADNLKIEREWGAVASSLYDLYKNKISTGNVDKAKQALVEFSTTLRNAIYIVQPSK